MLSGKSLGHGTVSVLPLKFLLTFDGPKLVTARRARRAVTLRDSWAKAMPVRQR